jgi:arylsulfatase A-like enzyme
VEVIICTEVEGTDFNLAFTLSLKRSKVMTYSINRLSSLWLATSWLLVLAVTATYRVEASEAAEKRPPNIILVLMDDMGWRDVGFMGNDFIDTPNLDRLAGSGITFTQAYASAPNCAPTRACLMSGQYTPRHGIYTVVDPRQPNGSPWHKMMGAESKSELDTEVVTIAERLQESGYETGFFGMWNLGRGRNGPMTPGGQGFSHVIYPDTIGFERNAYFDSDGNYLSDRLTDEVLKFMKESSDKPFFVYFADHAVHAPFEPKPDLLKKYENKLNGKTSWDPAHAATVEAVDQNIGRILTTLRESKIAENTLVIFTSDNGGTPQFVAPLNGSKGHLYEGGIRVPMVVAGAGVQGSGRKCDVPISSVDLYPTLLELAGIEAGSNQVLDGVSIKPILEGANELKPRSMFWHFPCYVGRATPSSAIRQGDYKLVEFFEDGGKVELYNLKNDEAEKNDLSAKMPEKKKELLAALKQWQKQTEAAIPTKANPDYDPSTERQRGRGPGGNGSANPNRNQNANPNRNNPNRNPNPNQNQNRKKGTPQP